ncbi:hypothetical protein SKAU_G00309710 [Synaphobranchus kaupii]|uniref:Uncharacterized protein n=1 Tax=Synaphobranchus kaupii TaxID=118154 RepID=A0A9Q1ERJ6_SYNKA|nr:hypothetical protein SKAU_G00309710 [Synaphobranchus kaupii]
MSAGNSIMCRAGLQKIRSRQRGDASVEGPRRLTAAPGQPISSDKNCPIMAAAMNWRRGRCGGIDGSGAHPSAASGPAIVFHSLSISDGGDARLLQVNYRTRGGDCAARAPSATRLRPVAAAEEEDREQCLAESEPLEHSASGPCEGGIWALQTTIRTHTTAVPASTRQEKNPHHPSVVPSQQQGKLRPDASVLERYDELHCTVACEPTLCTPERAATVV